MALQKLTERISYLPQQPEREFPLLAHIRGERYSLAVDAGYSERHVALFYSELAASGLPAPDFTALTHWHCDHSFGLHAVSGLTIACSRSNKKLREHALRSAAPAYREYMKRDEYFALEYGEERPIVIVPASVEFEESLTLDLGGVTARLFRVVSPHTDDCVCVHIPQERALFLGDAIYGNFDRNWAIDAGKLSALISTVESIDCDWYLPSHAHPHSRRDILRYLNRKLEQSTRKGAV